MDFFGYSIGDYIPSEISGLPATEIHHVTYRSQGGKDEITNLIALTREEHEQAHFRRGPFLHREYLMGIHANFMKHYENRDSNSGD